MFELKSENREWRKKTLKEKRPEGNNSYTICRAFKRLGVLSLTIY